MDRVLLHHLERISYNFLFFYRKFVSFFFPVGVINDKYNTNIIKHEILARYYIIHNKEQINNILNRHYLSNLKKYDYNILYKYSQNVKFNILFGLLTKEERISSSEYIFENFSTWIIK